MDIPKSSVRILFIDDKVDWTSSEEKRVIRMWEEGIPYQKMARIMRCSQKEMFLYLYELAYERIIEHRRGGILGEENKL